MQTTQWGQDESEHSNFKLQPGHSKAGHPAKHGALPAVLTADTPQQALAVPAWCSPEVTPGPGAYELQKVDSQLELIKVQRAAFGATGDGKAARSDLLQFCRSSTTCSVGLTWRDAGDACPILLMSTCLLVCCVSCGDGMAMAI